MYLAAYDDDAWRNYSDEDTNQNGTFYLFKKYGGITTYYSSNPSVPTALETVENAEKAVKSIVNGQLFIEKNGHVYNAMGQMVK